MDLKHQLLEKCTEILTEISSQQADDFFGTPPSVFYIDYGSGSESRFGFELTRIEETYRLFDGKIEVVKVGTEAQSEPVSRMFFKEGHATIGYDLDEGKAYLDFVAGPRYGRGFAYPLVKAEDGYQLGEPYLLWLS